ncbi:MAG TPA: acetyl-CoA acetyltransferase [Candidatus Limnocylindrales bacterium]|nr:acetyl-CoA acetyltransferase [Candidatus Limnocylindrales bacterium]
MTKQSSVVLIGVGQCVQREIDPASARNPVDLIREAALAAAADSGVGASLFDKLSLVASVDTFAWQPANASRLIAESVGAHPSREIVSTVGGNTPQAYVNYLSCEIAAGRAGLSMIAGANVVASLMKARAAGVRLDWPKGGEGEPEKFGEETVGSNDLENAHGLYLPVNTYPLFENALRARRGLGIAEHNLRIGEMFARFSEVASKNPYAWFPTARSAQEIATASEANRIVAFPYTKYMNAVMAVDQAAVLLLASTEQARELGVPEEKWVHFWGGGEASEDPWFVSERPRLDACPAMAFAARQAMASAGVSSEDLDAFDLYSCFPVAVELACEALGISEIDPRGLTVTGGLPYFGGPGNNYSTHAIASMVQRLREKPGSKGLVTANGWYLTKHAAGVYASAPRPAADKALDIAATEARHPEGPLPLAAEPNGRGRIDSYTVIYSRTGEPETGVIVGRLDSGERFLAHTPGDAALLEELVTREGVGRRGSVQAGQPVNLFTPE